MADQIKLPPSLAKRQTPAGSHHLGVKALFYGGPKSGKSFALASFPHPIFALSCGENGIELYLQPKHGDTSVFVDDAGSYLEALNFALDSPQAASVVVDNINLGYENWQQSWEEELGVEEIKGGNWRKVKGPWKTLHLRVSRSPKHFGASAWPRGAKYLEEEVGKAPPGVEPKKALRILEQDAPHVEKMIPFVVDQYYKTEILLDKRFAPTPIHRITYCGGRRPLSIPPQDLYAGKYWDFDSRKATEASPFDKILSPILDKWQMGAVDYINIDRDEEEFVVGEAKLLSEQQDVGRLLALISSQTSLKSYSDAWKTQIQVPLEALSKSNQALVMEAHQRKKKELGG